MKKNYQQISEENSNNTNNTLSKEEEKNTNLKAVKLNI